MTIVCKGWNGTHDEERILGVKEPLEDPRRSDTACPECREALLNELRRATHGVTHASTAC